MEELKNFYAKALLLKENELLIISYQINKDVIGKMELTKDIVLFKPNVTIKLKRVLIFVEEYAIEAKIIKKINYLNHEKI